MASLSRSRHDALLPGGALLLLLLLLLLVGHVCPFGAKAKRRICLMPKDPGRCKALDPRWYYDRYTQTCRRFNYGGCGGNRNKFQDGQQCVKTCIRIQKVEKKCRPPSDTGICKGHYIRFFFNLLTMKCEKFIYGGCKGNENRFPTKDSCLEFCDPDIRRAAEMLSP